MRPRRRRLLDLAFLVWGLVWVALAIQVAIEVRGLRDLSSTIKRTGVAVRESGEALERLNSLPIVGEEIGGSAQRIRQAGASAVESGESSRESIRNLSILLAIAIGVIPCAGVLGTYLELRRRAGRAGPNVPNRPGGRLAGS